MAQNCAETMHIQAQVVDYPAHQHTRLYHHQFLRNCIYSYIYMVTKAALVMDIRKFTPIYRKNQKVPKWSKIIWRTPPDILFVDLRPPTTFFGFILKIKNLIFCVNSLLLIYGTKLQGRFQRVSGHFFFNVSRLVSEVYRHYKNIPGCLRNVQKMF